MMMSAVNNQELIVVGNFYAQNGIIASRLNTPYAGAVASKELEQLFLSNTVEDYPSLAKHSNPTVRRLVVQNLECVDELLSDADADVRNAASFVKSVCVPNTDIRSYQCTWTSQGA